MPFYPVILHLWIYPSDILSQSTKTGIMVFITYCLIAKKVLRMTQMTIRRALIMIYSAALKKNVKCCFGQESFMDDKSRGNVRWGVGYVHSLKVSFYKLLISCKGTDNSTMKTSDNSLLHIWRCDISNSWHILAREYNLNLIIRKHKQTQIKVHFIK